MFKHEIEVRFRDIDAMGHVNNAVFLTYLEIVRTKFLASLLNKKQILTDDFPFILARVELDFKAPIGFQVINAEIWVSKIGTTSFEFSYKLSDESKIYAEAKTIQVCYDYKKKTKMTMPELLKKELEKHLV